PDEEPSPAQGNPSHPGLFSRIVRGEEQQWRVWEDEGHVAFLTPFPNAPGLTVLVPRRPLTSDIFRLEEADYTSLVLATQKVAKVLEEGLGAWGVGPLIHVHTDLVYQIL
uniref:HIT domain-containing protein n=1 Tax=Oncorhynchus mykiss TaxID=8022 RepID=A0A8L0DPM2_ONCMY